MSIKKQGPPGLRRDPAEDLGARLWPFWVTAAFMGSCCPGSPTPPTVGPGDVQCWALRPGSLSAEGPGDLPEPTNLQGNYLVGAQSG